MNSKAFWKTYCGPKYRIYPHSSYPFRVISATPFHSIHLCIGSPAGHWRGVVARPRPRWLRWLFFWWDYVN